MLLNFMPRYRQAARHWTEQEECVGCLRKRRRLVLRIRVRIIIVYFCLRITVVLFSEGETALLYNNKKQGTGGKQRTNKLWNVHVCVCRRMGCAVGNNDTFHDTQ